MAFDRRRTTIVKMLNEIEGVVLPDPARRVLRLPVGEGPARQASTTRRPAPARSTRPPQLAEYMLEDRRGGRRSPARPSGAPGYLRFSYALGDDDLVEGITRLQKLFA